MHPLDGDTKSAVPEADQKLMERLASLLNSQGAETQIVNNIQAIKYRKNMWYGYACFNTASDFADCLSGMRALPPSPP